MEKMNKEELVQYLIYNYYDPDNDEVDLRYLDFGGYNVNISKLQTNGDLKQRYQCVAGDLDQSHQEVEGNLYQSENNVGGNLSQDYQCVDGVLYQGWQKVADDLNQGWQEVDGDLFQAHNKVKTNLYQGSNTVTGMVIGESEPTKHTEATDSNKKAVECMDKKQLVEYMLDNYYSLTSDTVDLIGLDFGNHRVDISGLRTKKDLLQNYQEVGGDLYQNTQCVNGNLIQSNQYVVGKIIQDPLVEVTLEELIDCYKKTNSVECAVQLKER